MADLDATSCPFRPTARAVDAPDPDRARMRDAGPLVRLAAPAGGPVLVVTDAGLARQVLTDSRFAKDPALAPPGWDRRTAGLEPTAAEQMSLTTLDGPAHGELRRAFAPLFSAQRMRAGYPRMLDTARRLLADLAGAEVDLVEDFSTRYPLTVLCDLLGIPADRIDEAMAACRLMHVDYPANVGRAMAGFAALAGAASGGGLAQQLAARLPAGADLEYQVFTLLYAGQLTTDPAIGFLLARLLDGRGPTDAATLVRDTLAQHPPAPFSLWRFTTTEVELAGQTLPAHTPVLVDIEGINAVLDAGEHDLTFGHGPHHCTGAHLAQLELEALVEAVRTDHPQARLAVPFDQLRHSTPGGIMGSRLLALPVRLGRGVRVVGDRIPDHRPHPGDDS